MEKYKIVNEFLSKEEAQEWANYIIENKENHPYDNYDIFPVNKHQGKFDPDNKINNLVDIAHKWLSERYDLKELKYDRVHGTIMNPGSFLKPHRDMLPMKFRPHLTNQSDGPIKEQYEYACLLYLTDDYVGGDLIFEEEGVAFHLNAGDVIIFPNSLIKHEVSEIQSGKRILILIHFFGEDPSVNQ